MSYDKYQSWEWVNIQKEMEEDENSPSIMDDFKKQRYENKWRFTSTLARRMDIAKKKMELY